MPLPVGEILLNQYRIERIIGTGTFGCVYEARDLSRNRHVAVKELKPALIYDSELFQRFVREAEAAHALNHPHIVTTYGLEIAEDSCYIVMEYLDGGSLADLLRARGALTPDEAVGVTMTILDALAAVHARGIVHRDLKPSNILFSSEGHIKLCDFGIAHIPIPGEQSLTQVGTVLGSVSYMSPEQARGERVDARSDLYGVGALLYEMLAGHPYLNFGKNLLRNMDLVKNSAPLPLPPATPRILTRVVGKALMKDREARFQSASEMQRAGSPRPYTRAEAPRPYFLGKCGCWWASYWQPPFSDYV